MCKKFLIGGLLKFGKKEHMEQLLKNGTIYMNRLSCYVLHTNEQIGDKFEKTVYSVPVKDTITYINGKHIPTNESTGSTKIIDMGLDPFSYSMYAEYIDRIEDWENKIYIDNRVFEFGNAAIIIHEPGIFLKRILSKYPKIIHRKVKYIDENTYSGKRDFFVKSDKYEHQKEFRLAYFDNRTNKSVHKFDIGSIEDIARIEYF